MICPSPREKEAMFTAKTQKIEDVSDHNGSTKNSQVFSSRIESYQDDDEDEEEDQPFFIKRKTEVFKQKTSQGGKFKPGREIRKSDPTSSKTSSPNALDSGVSMSANNKKLKLLPSKEASLAGPGKPSVASKLLSANIPLPSRPVSGQQVSNDSKSLVQREGSNHVMPLSCRQSQSKAGAAAGIMLIKNDLSLNKEHPNTATTDSLQRNTEASDDSDDDKPLSQRLPVKLPIKVESRHDSDDNRPVASGRQTSGPVMRNVPGKHPLKSNAVLKKRHADNSEHPFNDTSSKKLKETSSKAESTEVMKDDEEDDIPLAHHISAGAPMKYAQKMEDEDEDDEDNIPLAQRISTVASMQKSTVTKKPSTTSKTTMAVKKVLEARKAKFKKGKQLASKHKKDVKVFKTAPGAGDGQKWTTLEHNGVIFPPLYKPHGVKMLYDGKPVDLTPEEEEVATMFAVMRDTDYVTKPKFLANFWNDWKKILRPGHVIKSLERCDFTPIYQWHLAEKEKKKQMRTEEKKTVKEEKLKQEEKYMWALVDGVKEKVGNFRVEPPGLFRGRGEHPKMGKLKRRIVPEDITINIGKGAPIPPCPIPGHRWKEIRHDNTVTWLAFWNDPINAREFKYVFLAASSSLKGQSDREKYEKARKLKDYITDIRKTYTKNFTSSDETTRQIAVATYLIDRLALRAGNEKDDDEADTVGCCSLKVEHVTLIPPRSLEFDFLGKDSIRYNNTVEVEAPVYKAIGDFKKSKREGQDLFDKLDTTKLNAHLKEIMPGLTAKVFRTYNASITLDTLLVNTNGQIVAEKIASYNSANKEVAVLCNHQRSVSKAHGAQMERLEGRMAELEALLEELKIDLNRAKKGKPPLKDTDGKKKRNQTPEALEKKILQTKQKIEKMKLDMKIKDDLKTVALGTSKINYLDPRITVAWCKRHEVPIEKIFNKSLLAKFAWAMDVEMEYCF